jgi:hypothetical protein
MLLVYIERHMDRQGKMACSATGKINPALGFANHGADLAYRARFTINFLVFDVMLHFVSPHRAEGASPHFPRRGETQNAVTNRSLQLHLESRRHAHRRLEEPAPQPYGPRHGSFCRSGRMT